MQFKSHEFYPYPVFTKLNDKSYELRPFTLRAETWAFDEFGSLEDLSDNIGASTEYVLKTLYHLIKDKSDFPDFFIFLEALPRGKEALKKQIQKFSIALQKTFDNSRPLVSLKSEVDLAKAKGNSQKPCYARYYDRIAARYGYTLDTFYDLTFRQIHGLLSIIDDQLMKDLEIEAALHDKKFTAPMAALGMDVEEEQEAEADAKEVLKRMQMEHLENGARNGR